jgi:hypothetical protein
LPLLEWVRSIHPLRRKAVKVKVKKRKMKMSKYHMCCCPSREASLLVQGITIKEDGSPPISLLPLGSLVSIPLLVPTPEAFLLIMDGSSHKSGLLLRSDTRGLPWCKARLVMMGHFPTMQLLDPSHRVMGGGQVL